MGAKWESGQEFRGLSMNPIYSPGFPKPLSELSSGTKNGLEGQLGRITNISFEKAMSAFSGYSV